MKDISIGFTYGRWGFAGRTHEGTVWSDEVFCTMDRVLFI